MTKSKIVRTLDGHTFDVETLSRPQKAAFRILGRRADSDDIKFVAGEFLKLSNIPVISCICKNDEGDNKICLYHGNVL